MRFAKITYGFFVHFNCIFILQKVLAQPYQFLKHSHFESRSNTIKSQNLWKEIVVEMHFYRVRDLNDTIKGLTITRQQIYMYNFIISCGYVFSKLSQVLERIQTMFVFVCKIPPSQIHSITTIFTLFIIHITKIYQNYYLSYIFGSSFPIQFCSKSLQNHKYRS